MIVDKAEDLLHRIRKKIKIFRVGKSFILLQ